MARKKRRGRPPGRKNKAKLTSAQMMAMSRWSGGRVPGNAKKPRKTAKRSGHIPLAILERRLVKLARVVKSRQ